jgi:pyruvate decarboxylase
MREILERKNEMAQDKSFTVGRYLAARLEQMGLGHYFAVPGDYNLMLFDELLKNINVEMICSTNELNAAYAAEGYARARGAGALAVTFNVGAFSALNGIAGAFAEKLPILFISSSYNTNDSVEDHRLHHTLGTHDLMYQREIISKVTCESVFIGHAADAPRMIDRAIRAALRAHRPAYIEIPCNLSNAPCSPPSPWESMRTHEASESLAMEAAVRSAGDLLRSARKPVLLAGGQLRAFGAIDAFRELAWALGCGVAVMPDAKGFYPEEDPQFIGVYWGNASTPGTEAIVKGADLILAAGPTYTDYSTVGWTAQPPRDNTIDAMGRYVRTPTEEYTDVELTEFLMNLAHAVQKNDTTVQQFQAAARKTRQPVVVPVTGGADGRLKRVEMMRQIQEDLDGKTTLFVESGNTWFDGEHMKLPEGARFEIEMLYGSIGWSVPASVGYALGMEPGRRVVSLVGDGAFRFTAQELSTAVEHKVGNLTFIIGNNFGYVVESAIHDGPYNYYKNWDYARLMEVFNAGEGSGLGLVARTPEELADALQKAKGYSSGPVLIECQIEHNDYNPIMKEWGTVVAKTNSRPPMHM